MLSTLSGATHGTHAKRGGSLMACIGRLLLVADTHRGLAVGQVDGLHFKPARAELRRRDGRGRVLHSATRSKHGVSPAPPTVLPTIAQPMQPRPTCDGTQLEVVHVGNAFHVEVLGSK